MPLQLLSSFGKKGVDHGLFKLKPDIEDNAYLSKYFDVAEFNPVFTAGKNVIAFNGSAFLAEGSEIKVQCIDSNGNCLYLDYPKSETQFADVAKFVIAIHVYNETYNGAGKIALVGTTPKGEIVRWKANISIDKTLQNVSKTRFQSTPTIEARSLLYPVIANDAAAPLTSVINYTGTFYANAITPQKDTIKSYINPKKSDTDYRITVNLPNQRTAGPQTYPTKSFNTQMEGQTIRIVTDVIQTPFSYREQNVAVTASFKVKKVIDQDTLQVDNPFFYTVGRDQVVTNINLGTFTANYKWIAYNTASDIYNRWTGPDSESIYQKESYAEIIYRNLTTFSGYIARHKLYRKSMLYPGDFTLVVDEPLGTRELLIDPVTANKSYNLIGHFYNQWHINKYWYTSSNHMYLSHSVTPRINAMSVTVSGSEYNNMDGTKYVIVKTDSVDTLSNDYIYRPYQANEFNELQGLSYQSNFLDLKSGSLYVLSFNLSVDKPKLDVNSRVEFYFTTSIAEATKEKYWIPPLGIKLGQIAVPDKTEVKIFADKQYVYFTPMADYFGTLMIVPYHCGVTFSEMSLGVYSDYGFSPDSMTTKVPWRINVANESFQIKTELYDINSTLVYNNLNTIQTFDFSGSSLFAFIGTNPADPSYTSFVSGSLTISKSLYVWDLQPAPPPRRLMGYVMPTHNPRQSGDGLVGYTNILDVTTKPTVAGGTTQDYVSVTTTTGEERAIAVHYSGSLSQGRRIWVQTDGTKYTYQ
jgi:hypothetical protein